MNRRADVLLPIEISLLDVGVELAKRGAPTFHGFLIAKKMRERDGARLLTAYGTLYKALERLERRGLLESQWEDPLVAAEEGRPRRRLYQVTAAGVRALSDALASRSQASLKLEPEAGLG